MSAKPQKRPRRLALLPVVAGVAAAAFLLRLPDWVEAVERAMPQANSALAAEAPAPDAAPAPESTGAESPEPVSAPTVEAPRPAFDPDKLTPGEIDVLQNLSRRRAEIEARMRELDSREALIAAAEARVDKKLAELKAVEAKIAAAEKTRTAEDEARMERLVKVYETMKPADAAAIFNTLDFSVLIEVAGRMKERSIAPVLAAMDPEVAKALTVALATRRDQPATGSGG
ncbi:MAG: hypothetical protein PHS60_11570 [Zavarzinia sp.]|nr:hypothetical protein [Zavarzinia sp.]